MRERAPTEANEQRGAKVIELPLVLAIGCAPSFVERCRMLGAVAQSKFLVRRCDLSAARALDCHPVIIVVPRDLYDQRSAEFDRLAERSNAALLMC